MKVSSVQELSNYLRKRRKDIGIRQEDIADLADIQRESLARIENGKRDLKMSTLLRLCEALKLEVTIRERQ
jgi:transcriptional regulator with XRE-family HTH domain